MTAHQLSILLAKGTDRMEGYQKERNMDRFWRMGAVLNYLVNRYLNQINQYEKTI